jgi:S-adenosylmethionine:tRNA ribosyltransferase-isomerase
LSSRLPGGFWSVELRHPTDVASLPCRDGRPGMTLDLPAGARVTLLAQYPLAADPDSPSRLWMAEVRVPGELDAYLTQHGFPIRYGYVPQSWPSAMYQTVFATEPGSAEMPSAARPFTAGLVTRLVARGVQFAPLVLHTGVASLEDHEPPYEERYRVSRATADRVNATRNAGHRVVAVGTTVVRALETVTDARGTTHPGEGWTDLVIPPGRSVRAVDSLITGLHEPHATHLAVLTGVIDRPQLSRAYAAARQAGYLWHEFGDSHLILGRQ